MQIWCGQAMGAFNAWVRGSYLEPVEDRGVVDVGLHLLTGAACCGRAHAYRLCGGAAEPSPYLPREKLA